MNTLDAAVRNNAAWCECVSRVHDAGGAFTDTYWKSSSSPPRFYPDLVTLTPEGSGEQRAAIQALARPTWHVKDSFAVLDLSLLGAHVIIEAHWQMRSPSVATGEETVVRIDSEPDLAEWESRWTDDPTATRVFLPALLADCDVDFLGLRRAGEITAGAIFNRSHGVCGFTNLFGEPDEAARIVGAASSFSRGLPVVFYSPTVVAGCTRLGPLRVWAHP